MNHAYRTMTVRGLWITVIIAMACALAVAIADCTMNGAMW